MVRDKRHRVYAKAGCEPITVASTSSDKRAEKNNLCRLNRAVRAAEEKAAAERAAGEERVD